MDTFYSRSLFEIRPAIKVSSITLILKVSPAYYSWDYTDQDSLFKMFSVEAQDGIKPGTEPFPIPAWGSWLRLSDRNTSAGGGFAGEYGFQWYNPFLKQDWE